MHKECYRYCQFQHSMLILKHTQNNTGFIQHEWHTLLFVFDTGTLLGKPNYIFKNGYYLKVTTMVC
jgi:hypothetical protein